jgi:hypothetical protein
MPTHAANPLGLRRLATLSLLAGGLAAATPFANETKVSGTVGGLTGPVDAADNFGTALAPLGDFDGDGIEDLAVGAPGDDDGGFGRGAVYLLFLNADGTVKDERKISQTSPGFFFALDDFDLFGSSVDCLGDLDGNGVSDLLVGAPQDDDGGLDAGAAYVVFLEQDGSIANMRKLSAIQGHASGVTPLPLTAGVNFGRAVCHVGEVDGDNLQNEVAVGAPRTPGGGFTRGAVYVLSLDASGGITDHQLISDQAGGPGGMVGDGDRFGSALAGPGDLNCDGTDDLFAGAPYDDTYGNNRGAVFTLWLKPDKTLTSIDWIVPDFTPLSTENNLFAAGLASAGDLNGDGTTDLIIGTPGMDGDAVNQGGYFLVFLDHNAQVIGYDQIGEEFEPMPLGFAFGDEAGYGVAILGDLSDDGQRDYAIGFRGDDDSGSGSGSLWNISPAPGAYAHISPYVDLGGALTGRELPRLSGTGELEGGDTGSLILRCIQPFTTTWLVSGTTELGVPFKGGTLVPFPEHVSPAMTAHAFGGVVKGFHWPAGLPLGTAMVGQFWILDPHAAEGYSASNGLALVQQ